MVNGWQIGDGVSVHAWNDPCLPWPRDFRPLSRLSGSASKVSEFITNDRTWNVSLLEEQFEQPDIDLILTIPLSHRITHDKVIWHYDSKGRFWTRSA